MGTAPLSLFSTRDLKVAVALLTLGFEPESDAAPVTRIKRESGQESVVFWFKAAHPITAQSADEIMRHMTTGADEFAAKNPEHPLTYIRAALLNRDELVSVIKATPRQLIFERNGKIISMSENATAEDKARFAKFI